MKHLTASIAAALLLASLVAGCSPTSGTQAARSEPSVGESLTAGPLEYRLDATFTAQPDSDSERLALSVMIANLSDATATLTPSVPELTLRDASGELPLVGGDGESRGWWMEPGSYEGDDSAELGSGGYFLIRRTFKVRDEGELTATVSAQDSGDLSWKLR